MTDSLFEYKFACPWCSTENPGEWAISPPVPGRYSGPPENCYPDEPGYAELVRPETCVKCEKEFDGEDFVVVQDNAFEAWCNAQEPEVDPDNPDEGWD